MKYMYIYNINFIEHDCFKKNFNLFQELKIIDLLWR
jgi:hypothetical protein